MNAWKCFSLLLWTFESKKGWIISCLNLLLYYNATKTYKSLLMLRTGTIWWHNTKDWKDTKQYRHHNRKAKQEWFPQVQDNSQSHSENVFCVDDPRSEPRVLHELTQDKMAEDAESGTAIRFVDENDYRKISAKAESAKGKLKKNRPSSLV